MDSNTWLHTLVYICSSIVTISAAVGILGNKVKKWINDDIANSIGKEFDEKIGKLRGDLNKHIQNSEDSNVIIKKTLLDDTRNTLYQAYNTHMKSKNITDHEMYIINQIYDNYRALGGNSFIVSQITELRELHSDTHNYKGGLNDPDN